MTKTLATNSAKALGYDGTVVVSMGVSNLDKAIEWYGEVLGFELSYKMEDIGWCEMKSATTGLTFGLSQVEKVKPGDTTPTLGIKDIEQARGHLEAHQVRFDGPTQTIAGLVKLATFYDPDGNSFMLAQTLAG
jgi:catechol 2,3-dioxygenase-like lactoylglutathione lyase family enzyme